MTRRPFLTARWHDLIMLNYEVEPRSLEPFLPAGTELDTWQGKTFVSMVGFMFLDTKLLGIPIPFHRNFEEVNLRFYVRRKAEDGKWRRAVVFIKEIVPRPMIAWVARALYGEKYVAMPMQHHSEIDGHSQFFRYAWRYRGQENYMSIRTGLTPVELCEDGLETFITEHYWGYAKRRGGTTEYEVAHPRWQVFTAQEYAFHCDVVALYGQEFAEYLQLEPASAFLARGSETAVYCPRERSRQGAIDKA